MRRLLVIGIGAGDPAYLTMQAVDALNETDVFFVLDKGLDNDDMSRIRQEICARFIREPRYRVVHVTDPRRDRTSAEYTSAVHDWHDALAQRYEQLLTHELEEDGVGSFLVWGDPALYDSTLRVIERITARGAVAFDYDVIPGISSVQALAAKHRLLLNRIGEPVHITTGRLLAAAPDQIDNVVVMLDAHCRFMQVDPHLHIYWGAYLGTADEELIAGRIADVGEQIVQRRQELRAAKGWIMDTYILRRSAE
jgi:precorrin-6A synthase